MVDKEYTVSFKNPVIQIVTPIVLAWILPAFLPSNIGTWVTKGLNILSLCILLYWIYVLIAKYTPVGKWIK